ncbi:carboxypeptidase-like regulatory domain-containing protein, partial [bacterium]|nr:carboxypeptidase-like regulatory domain-containing protein [bacterium]
MKRLKITFLAICMSLTAYSDDSYKIRWGIGLLSEEIQLQKDDYKLNAGASSISGISSNATHTIMSSLSFFRLLPKGQILGTVCDLLLDRPIDSATVKVKRQRSEDRIQMTDGNGKYIFDGQRLIFGTYTLTVTRKGYYPATRTIKLRGTTTKNIALCPLKRNIPANIWKMWSPPATPETSTTINGNTIIVGSNLGGINNIGDLEIRCYRWDANADDDPLYGKYRRPPLIRTGESYWLKSYGAEANLLVGEVVNSTTQTITLSSGWNQIANPFNFMVSKSDILIGTQPLTSDLWGWTDTEYLSSEAILPWKGYFLYANEACELTVPPVPCDDSSVSVSILNDNYLWSIKLSASSGIYSDRENLIGIAKDGKGNTSPEPPTPHVDNYVRLVISNSYAQEIRSQMADSNEWDISIVSTTGEPITLSWSDLSAIPKEYGVYLIDGDNVIDMRKSQQSTINNQ